MAHEEQRRAGCVAFLQQQFEKRLLAVRVERRRRLVGDDDLGTADERARRRDALLLADRQLGRPLRASSAASRSRCASSRSASARTEPPRDRPRAAPRREAARQHHVVEHRQIRHQVEVLEDVADVIAAEAVARGTRAAGSSRCRAPVHVPRCGVSTPPSSASSVLLPLPLGPWMNMRSPLVIARSGISRHAAALSGPGEPKRADPDDGLGTIVHQDSVRLPLVSVPARCLFRPPPVLRCASVGGKRRRPSRAGFSGFAAARTGTRSLQ